ncbi:hypothetical protein [Burkholderia sp. AW49-1]
MKQVCAVGAIERALEVSQRVLAFTFDDANAAGERQTVDMIRLTGQYTGQALCQGRLEPPVCV